jgi:hypothetical protein
VLAALLLAATLPLGVWPDEAGPPAAVVEEVEFYRSEPEDDYWIVAVRALSPPLARTDEGALRPLALLAMRLGADAVILLAELDEAAIPDDVEEPLPRGGRFAAAAFVVFDCACGDERPPVVQGALEAPALSRPRPPVDQQPAGTEGDEDQRLHQDLVLHRLAGQRVVAERQAERGDQPVDAGHHASRPVAGRLGVLAEPLEEQDQPRGGAGVEHREQQPEQGRTATGLG